MGRGECGERGGGKWEDRSGRGRRPSAECPLFKEGLVSVSHADNSGVHAEVGLIMRMVTPKLEYGQSPFFAQQIFRLWHA